MSDARWIHGLIRSRWRKPRTNLDNPIYHGWKRAGLNEDGEQLYTLESATMRRTLPRDQLEDDWLVFVNGKAVAAFTGKLGWITQQVREVLCQDIPFQGEPCLQADGSEIGEAGL